MLELSSACTFLDAAERP